MSFFSRVFRSKDPSKKSGRLNGLAVEPEKPAWTDAWLRTEVEPEEVVDLLLGCTGELKDRALDIPFLLLPFRPTSDPSAAKTFIRNFFSPSAERTDRSGRLQGAQLAQELRLSEPMVLCSVMKWCWARLPGGVVTWEAYELFKVGENDAQFARDAFSTFIPLSVDSDARTKIIFAFFDLMAAIAAHGKSNGLGGRKLSRYAGWWAFEHADSGKGFEASYKTWASAADATSHLFFAYLRSQSPESLRGTNGISTLPLSLQNLVRATEYPPEAPSLLQTSTTKVVMLVDVVSPTPFALLRRAKNFEYRASDHALQQFASYDDPQTALTEECKRVLRCIATTNQSEASTVKASTSLQDASWSRFEDIGFGGAIEEDPEDKLRNANGTTAITPYALRSAPQSRNTPNLARPTTPSWADFLSSGFSEENGARSPTTLLLPPDKILPPLQAVRGQSSQSHKRGFDDSSALDPGELASISTLDLDDSFWWVWVSSLSGEESAVRKAVFGRCALLETIIPGGKWLILEEQIKGAAPEPEAGAYIAEKKTFFGFKTRKGRLGRSKSTVKKIGLVGEQYNANGSAGPASKTSIGPDQHARIQAAAAALQRKRREQELEEANKERAKTEMNQTSKTNSVHTLQPAMISEMSQAMKWANNYDKNNIRNAYLENSRAGKGQPASSFDLGSRSSTDQNKPDVPPKHESSTSGRDIPSIRERLPKSPTSTAPGSGPATPRAASPAPGLVESINFDKPTPPPPHVPAIVPVTTTTITASPSPAPATVPHPVKEETTETSVADDRKLKKKPGNTGLKGMFGGPKADQAEKESAVAAARAALEGRTAQAQAQPASSSARSSPTPSSRLPGTRRLSGFGMKRSQDETKPAVIERKPAPPAKEERKPTPPVPAKEARVSPPPPEVQNSQVRDLEPVSPISPETSKPEASALSSFSHQSPVVDQPACVPVETTTPPAVETKEVSPVPSSAPSSVPSPAPVQATQPSESKTFTVEAEKEVPAAAEPEVPALDRWAQIRKNAAQRAAVPDAPSAGPTATSSPAATTPAKQSTTQQESKPAPMQQSPMSHANHNPAIEMRAARIKARVAELTKNMESSRAS
ncbi:hypothetical protein McanMca71_005452 [Microsporum canis]